MNTGRRPDLLAVCEVENRFVVDRLVEAVNAAPTAPRSYAAVHADTGDARGIKVAFTYDATLFQVWASRSIKGILRPPPHDHDAHRDRLARLAVVSHRVLLSTILRPSADPAEDLHDQHGV
jgi:hypothetical protein